MSLILTIVFAGTWDKPESAIKFVVDDLEQAKEIVRHHKNSTKAKMIHAYITVVYMVD